MSWSFNFETKEGQSILATANEITKENKFEGRQLEQAGIAAVLADDLAEKIGGTKHLVQLNGHANPEAGSGDSIGVYVYRRD